ncbi:hypothetical protein B0H67DRAFT_249920 [Lasiosphaeris hirsuta]|uniref:Uncharacterized protein n=1 Tax=Lasiosphaeris hirsuta TaxID=260670 RepID=A0AA40DWL6_9PEZI|nr:hypothetical protein B0H67DRAFT_249920 [Lasiosphaeris hirsuta]
MPPMALLTRRITPPPLDVLLSAHSNGVLEHPVLPFYFHIFPPTPITILPRQATQTPAIPAFYGSLDGPSPGTIVGITLGSVAGFILVLWLIYMCINLGNPGIAESSSVGSVVRSSKHHHRHSHRRSRHGGSGSATAEVRRTTTTHPATIIVEDRVRPMAERVVVEESRRRRSSVSRGPGPRVVDATDDDDEVVVIEEHSPPRRQRSRIRSAERRSSGYREVDPDQFAGGEAEIREVRPPRRRP